MKYPYAVKIDDKLYKAGEDVSYSRKFITKLFDVTKSTILPKLFLTGDTMGISKDNSVKMTVEYIIDDFSFSDNCTLKYQGTSSLGYPKKNFTIKFGNKVDLGFGEQKKYCLKANYIDHSHARNIVSARLWSEIVKSRESYNKLPVQLKNSPNNGAIDGYPIKLYLNGKYEGLYTLNVPKDAWMFNMDNEEDKHCVLCGEDYLSGCFRAPANIDGTDWSDEVHDTVPTSILTRWNEVIEFVRTSTDEDFKANIDNYIDLESLIDYFVFAYASCGLDSMGKNQIYCTYNGVKWYASMYDMDSTWGLYYDGDKFVSSQYKCQDDYECSVSGRSGNLLYKRLEELFPNEIYERYNELRNTILSIKNVICKFENFTDLIKEELYAEDCEIYAWIPSKDTNNIKQIRTYAKARFEWLDTALYEQLFGEDVSLDEYLKLKIDANSINESGTIDDVEIDGYTRSVNIIGDTLEVEDGEIVFDGTKGISLQILPTYAEDNTASSNSSLVGSYESEKTLVLDFTLDESLTDGTNYPVLLTAPSMNTDTNKIEKGSTTEFIYFRTGNLYTSVGDTEDKSITITKGEKHRLALTYKRVSGTQFDSNWVALLDGNVINTKTNENKQTYSYSVWRYIGINDVNGVFPKMKMSALRLYNRALTAEEIASL